MKKPAGILGALEVVLEVLAKLLATGLVTFWSMSFGRMQLKYLSSVALFGSNLKWSMVMTLPFVIANDNIGATGFFLPSDFVKVTDKVQFSL